MNSPKQTLTAKGTYEAWGPLLEVSTREVFQLMLSSELSSPTGEVQPPRGVTSMVGLAGQLCGVLSVQCDEKTGTIIASKMLGIPVDKAGPEMSDAMGEISNMVAGNFKNKVSGLGDGCMLSPPTVVMGSDFSTYALADNPALEVRVLFEGQPVVISLQIHS
jgi:chemotaxis protein CheX